MSGLFMEQLKESYDSIKEINREEITEWNDLHKLKCSKCFHYNLYPSIPKCGEIAICILCAVNQPDTPNCLDCQIKAVTKHDPKRFVAKYRLKLKSCGGANYKSQPPLDKKLFARVLKKISEEDQTEEDKLHKKEADDVYRNLSLQNRCKAKIRRWWMDNRYIKKVGIPTCVVGTVLLGLLIGTFKYAHDRQNRWDIDRDECLDQGRPWNTTSKKCEYWSTTSMMCWATGGTWNNDKQICY